MEKENSELNTSTENVNVKQGETELLELAPKTELLEEKQQAEITTTAEKHNELSTEFVEPKSIDYKKIITILVVILILLIGFGYKLYFSDSMVLFKTMLNRGYNEFSEALDKAEENSIEYNYNDNIVIDGNLNLESSLEELSSYNGYSYNFNLGMNLKQEKLGLSLAMLKDKQNVIDGLFYLTKNMMYVKSEKVYPQVLYLDMGENIFDEISEEDFKKQYNYDDIDRIVEKMTIYLGNAFDKEQFKKEDDTLQISGEEINIVKHIYTIDQNSAYNIMTSILTDIKADEEFIDLLAKVSSTPSNEIKEGLDEMKVEKEAFEGMEAVNLNLYTTGFFSKFLGMGLSSKDVNMTLISKDNQVELNIISSDTTLNIITKDGITTGTMKSAGEELLTFTIKEEEKENKYKNTIELKMPAYPINATLVAESNKISNKKIDSKINLNINMGSGNELTTISTDISYNLEVGATVPETPSEGAVDMSILTEEEQLKLLTNLQNAVVGTPLESLFISTQEPSENAYNTMYRLEDFANLLKPSPEQLQ